MRNLSKTAIMFATVLAFTSILFSCGNSSSTPTTVPNSATIFYAHNLAFRNSSTFSTGYNAFGQLGSGDLGNRTQPGPLNGVFSFKGFALGGVHSVAFSNDSTVRTWGYNGFGQLGNGTTTFSSIPIKPVGTSGVVHISRVKAVAAGGFHTLALAKDNKLWAWGKNDLGQLGVGAAATAEIKEKGYSTVPVEVSSATVSPLPFTNISSIAANGHHSLARANGKVWAWGLNSSGQLGVDPATTGAMSAPNMVFGILSSGVSGIAAGGGFSYAVDRDGHVWAWGANENGQLGNGTTTLNFTPGKVQQKVATGLADLAGIVQVAAGIQHGLARDGVGNVWAWGYNFFGQLGLGSNNTSDSPVAVQVLLNGKQLTDATDIRAFGSSSMAKVGNVWYVWGDNSFGQLGIGSTGTVPIPVPSGF